MYNQKLYTFHSIIFISDNLEVGSILLERERERLSKDNSIT